MNPSSTFLGQNCITILELEICQCFPASPELGSLEEPGSFGNGICKVDSLNMPCLLADFTSPLVAGRLWVRFMLFALCYVELTYFCPLGLLQFPELRKTHIILIRVSKLPSV